MLGGRKKRAAKRPVNYSVLNTVGLDFPIIEEEIQDLQQSVISPVKTQLKTKSKNANPVKKLKGQVTADVDDEVPGSTAADVSLNELEVRNRELKVKCPIQYLQNSDTILFCNTYIYLCGITKQFKVYTC